MLTRIKPIYALFLTAFFMLLASCIREPSCPVRDSDTQQDSTQSRLTTIMLDFYPQTMTVVQSRSGNAIRDVNLYIYEKATQQPTHIYSTQHSGLSIPLAQGEYELLAVANAGRDLGSKTRAEAEALTLDFPAASIDDLYPPLSGKESFTAGPGTDLSVSLAHSVARIEYQIKVADSFASAFTLQSVQLFNLPLSCGVFAQGSAQLASIELYNAGSQGSSASGSFYMPENCAGNNASITDQRQKNKTNAPSNASYLFITGEHPATREIIHYTVFLGENNTTDFNVRRNTHYFYEINLHGVNKADTRVTATSYQINLLSANWQIGTTVDTKVNLKCVNNHDTWVELSYQANNIYSNTLIVDGAPLAPGASVRVLSPGQESRDVTLSLPATQSGPFWADVKLVDSHGYTTTRTISGTPDTEITLSASGE